MSVYAWLLCEESKQMIWLGKHCVAKETGEPYFHIGGEAEPRNSDNPLMMKAVMKFFAMNLGKTIRVVLEDQFEEIVDEEYVEIGDDECLNIPFEEYIENFKG